MVKITNQEIRVPFSAPEFFLLKISLNCQENTRDGFYKPIYRIENNEMVIDRGLKSLLLSQGLLTKDNIQEEIVQELNISMDYPAEYWKSLLPGITLRIEQILSVKKCLLNRRGLIQSATASGKSEMICGVMKHLYNELQYYPTTVVIVPTEYLMEQMRDRMKKYGIPSRIYNTCRGDLEGIVITHPKSISNDLENGKINFDNLKVLIGDEAHHSSAKTFYNLYKKSINAEFVLGFSASIIESKRLPIERVSQLYYDEARTIGAIGPILIDIPPSFYQGKGILAESIVIRIDHPANEIVSKEDNWHELRKKRLESESRNAKIIDATLALNKEGLKSLILINTHEHGYRLLDMFNEKGFGDVTACSFGGKAFYKFIEGRQVRISSESMSKFDSGELQILIGTSHIYEGVDVPNLDAVIMAVTGKANRRIIQAVGRSLRRTKNGKYSYIIDFTDGKGVLNWHSRQRKNIYSETIGVPFENIYDNVPIEKIGNLISNIEKFR